MEILAFYLSQSLLIHHRSRGKTSRDSAKYTSLLVDNLETNADENVPLKDISRSQSRDTMRNLPADIGKIGLPLLFYVHTEISLPLILLRLLSGIPELPKVCFIYTFAQPGLWSFTNSNMR